MSRGTEAVFPGNEELIPEYHHHIILSLNAFTLLESRQLLFLEPHRLIAKDILTYSVDIFSLC